MPKQKRKGPRYIPKKNRKFYSSKQEQEDGSIIEIPSTYVPTIGKVEGVRYEDLELTDKYNCKAVCEFYMRNQCTHMFSSSKKEFRRIDGLIMLHNQRVVPLFIGHDYVPRQIDVSKGLIDTPLKAVGPRIKMYAKDGSDLDCAIELYNQECKKPFLRIEKVIRPNGDVTIYDSGYPNQWFEGEFSNEEYIDEE